MQTGDDPRRGEERCSVKSLVAVACAVGLTIGFFDVATTLSFKPTEFTSLGVFLAQLAISSVSGSLVYLALSAVLVYPLSRLPRLSALPLALSLAVFLCTLFVAVSVGQLIPFSLSAFDLARLLILVGVAALLAAGSYVAFAGLSQAPSYRRLFVVVGTSVPFLLGALALLLWALRFESESLISLKSALAVVAFLVGSALLVKMIAVVTRRNRAFLPLLPLLAVVVASPFVYRPGTGPSEHVGSEREGSTPAVKYVILIIVDTLRADFLSCYSADAPRTPNIDRLAGESVLFREAIAPAPWTLPSVSSIMTGLSPLVHSADRARSKLPTELTTLAERMQGAGYHTAGIGFSPFLTAEYNMSQGFSEFYFPIKSGRSNSLGGWILQSLLPDLIPSTENTQKLTDIAAEWLGRNREEPFFLWLHYFDPHEPYAPPAAYLPDAKPPRRIGTSFGRVHDVRGGYFVPSLKERDWVRRLYAAEVRYVDDCLGQLMDSLRERGMFDDALIILTSDHGEEFWEHGRFEHGHSLYEELLWVPLLLKLPRSSSQGEVDVPVTTESIMPTVLELCGMDYDGRYLSAGSLVPVMSGGAEEPEESLLSSGVMFYDEKESLVFDNFKYIRDLVTHDEELFDLVGDPRERSSVASSFPEVLEDARVFLEGHHTSALALRDHYGVKGTGAEASDEATMERLRSLGYIR
jgi:arylsulfatase A-like enzyme